MILNNSVALNEKFANGASIHWPLSFFVIRWLLMDISSALTAQIALTRQNAAMSMLKASADADQAIVNMLSELVDNVPAGSRGGLVNITA